VTDVLLRQTDNGGEITIEAGLLLMSEGLETAAYLSLFGGNEDDPAGTDTSRQWWGNLLDVEPERHYRSETQALVQSLPAIPFNLRRIEQAAARDLQWMLDAGVATSITVEATIPAVNRVRVGLVILTADGQRVELFFG
jgi:phage gp46-like protein